MFCSNCGSDNNINATFCENCGQKLKKTSKVTIEETNKSFFIIALVLLVLLGIVFSFFYFRDKSKSVEKVLPKTEHTNIYTDQDSVSADKYENNSLQEADNPTSGSVNYSDIEKEVENKIYDFDKYLNEENFYQAYKIIMDFKKQGVSDEDLLGLYNNFEGALNYRLDTNATYNDYGSSVAILQELLELDPDNEFFKGCLADAMGNREIWKH